MDIKWLLCNELYMKIVCMFVVKNRLLKNVSHKWKYWCSYLVLKIVLSMLYLKLKMIN